MNCKYLIGVFFAIFTVSSFALPVSSHSFNPQKIVLQKQTGFIRFSYDQVTMPSTNPSMGLLGVNYFSDLTPLIYGGMGLYGAVNGNQGGLFILGVGAGLHREMISHWWSDVGLYVGGGGGRSSLVGGGLMLRPHVGFAYEWEKWRLGLHYSYIDFPTGKIRSHQVGIDLDIPLDFYYLNYGSGNTVFQSDSILTPLENYLSIQRNDIGLLLQAYRQPSGTRNVNGEIQNGTLDLVGIELDHYLTEKLFWSLKGAGAFHGIPNGYMDVFGGLGYRQPLGLQGVAWIPEFDVGAGGGGNVDTGGGLLFHPQMGIEWPLSSRFAMKIKGGYLWGPHGNFKAMTLAGEILYHLDLVSAETRPTRKIETLLHAEDWRVELLDQIYLHPQRTARTTTSAVHLVSLQIDQLFNPFFFLSYQGSFAYQGNHSGGFATGMIGPGLQSKVFCHQRLQFFTEVLVGAGGGGGLALGGGALIEPLVGIHYAVTKAIGLQASVGQIKALQHDLNTPIINFGMTIRFGTLTA